jgi:hypothetical protein
MNNPSKEIDAMKIKTKLSWYRPLEEITLQTDEAKQIVKDFNKDLEELIKQYEQILEISVQ